ncbi:MAG: cation diffusion facilitator family transporter [Chloroflexi bacterium]|nr:cation diffusion facilitator family transporter [Chloroflexota bacterium]
MQRDVETHAGVHGAAQALHLGHAHHHRSIGSDRAFAVAIALNVAFVLVEAAFGLLANSLALLSDAGHNLNDVLSLLLAWGAVALARRQATPYRTYGWGRSTILVAVANAVMLLVVVGAISWEALRRFADPNPVAEGTMIWVAAIGVLINGGTALMFVAGRQHDVNIRGAFLHMASDAGVSGGVMLAAVAIGLTGWLWIDPGVGLMIGVVILWSTWGLLRASLNLALDAVPEGVDAAGVQTYLTTLPRVRDVHDLHIWAMSSTETALTAHLIVPDGGLDDALLVRVADELGRTYRIQHATLQLECGDPNHPCPLVGVHAV